MVRIQKIIEYNTKLTHLLLHSLKHLIMSLWWHLIIYAVVSRTRVVEAANAARLFTFGEMIRATNNFSTEIGRGGFGIVFKGSLGDGKFVAVKVLSDASQQGPHEFLNEVLS